MPWPLPVHCANDLTVELRRNLSPRRIGRAASKLVESRVPTSRSGNKLLVWVHANATRTSGMRSTWAPWRQALSPSAIAIALADVAALAQGKSTGGSADRTPVKAQAGRVPLAQE